MGSAPNMRCALCAHAPTHRNRNRQQCYVRLMRQAVVFCGFQHVCVQPRDHAGERAPHARRVLSRLASFASVWHRSWACCDFGFCVCAFDHVQIRLVVVWYVLSSAAAFTLCFSLAAVLIIPVYVDTATIAIGAIRNRVQKVKGKTNNKNDKTQEVRAMKLFEHELEIVGARQITSDHLLFDTRRCGQTVFFSSYFPLARSHYCKVLTMYSGAYSLPGMTIATSLHS